MEPEIARRCSSCGAAVRGRAHFCPQCGRPMGEGEGGEGEPADAPPPPPREHTLADEAERVAVSLSARLSDPRTAAQSSSFGKETQDQVLEVDATPPPVAVQATAPRVSAPALVSPEIEDGPAGEGERADDGAPRPAADTRGGVRGRAAAAGASVGGSLKPRVERLREASSVVIDEAADDPGVRYLVIAAVVFLLFLLLWLLSFTLG